MIMEEPQLVIKGTAQLSSLELLKILEERVKVFVVEQKCPYQEVDEKDADALHVYFKQNHELAAYARIVPHDNNKDISFGRILVVKKYRSTGLGRKLVTETLKQIRQRYPHTDVKIQAETYLLNFYSSFGFRVVSGSYLVDGVSHTDMILSLK